MEESIFDRLMSLTPEERSRLESRDPSAVDGVGVVSREGGVGVSFAQERLWFVWRLAPGSAAYNVPLSYVVRGRLDVGALGHAVGDLVGRHEVLRSVFREVDGRVVAVAGEGWGGGVEVVEVGGGVDEARRLAVEFGREPFDLSEGPLLRVRVFRCGEDLSVLSVVAHHIVVDEWSLEILERELGLFYSAALESRGAGLPSLGVQYADFASWQRAEFESGGGGGLEFWRSVLAGSEPELLAVDRPRGEVMSFHGDRVMVRVPVGVSRDLEKVAARCGATRFMVLVAAFSVVLSRVSGRGDVVLGTAVSGRERPETAGLLGFFVNTLVLRVPVDRDLSFLGLVNEVRDVVLSAFEHQDVPFERVVRELAPRRDAARNPLFQVMLTYAYDRPEDAPRLSLAGAGVEPQPTETDSAHFDLTLGIEEGAGGMLFSLEYNRDLFAPETIQALACTLTDTLHHITGHPDDALVSLMGAASENNTPAVAPRSAADGAQVAADGQDEPPRTALERQLAEIWETVLGDREISRDADFFALGGHSLLATRLIFRISEEIGVRLPLHAVFTHPTLAAQADLVTASIRADSVADGVGVVSREGGVGVSFAQERLWFVWRLAPGSAAYNVPLSYVVRGRLDVGALGHAVGDLVGRHEVLRSVFREVDGRVVAVAGEGWGGGVEVVEVGGGVDEARRLAVEFGREPFDLSEGPLLRVRVFRCGEDLSVLSVVAHHIVVDEWSLEILERELGLFYSAALESRGAGLPSLGVQYADFASWQRAEFESGGGGGLEFWRSVLAGSEPELLAVDRPRGEVMSFHGDRVMVRVPVGVSRDLEKVAARCGATRFMVLVAAFSVVLSRVSGRGDVVLGTAVSGRERPETAGLLGFFVNTLVLRVPVDRDLSFLGLVNEVRDVVLSAFEHQDVPFERVVRELAPRRDAARNPLFQVMLTYAYDRPEDAPRLSLAGAGVEPQPTETDSAHFDLTLGIEEGAGGMLFSLEYNRDLFAPETIQALACTLTDTLHHITGDPDTPVHALTRISEAERRTLASWNDTSVQVPSRTFPELFAEQVARTPGAIALEHRSRTLSYRELDARASRTGEHLRALGAGPESTVVICLPPGPDLVAALLGTWKTGAAFVPISPAWPAERVRHVIEEARPVAAVVTAETEDLLTAVCGPPPLRMDRPSPARPAPPATGHPAAHRAPAPGSLAYILYTSGSTGRPKGVMIEHRSLTNHLYGQTFRAYEELEARTARPLRVGLSASVVFDVYINQLALLLRGHTLVLPDEEDSGWTEQLLRAADGDTALDAIDCATVQLDLLVGAGLLECARPPWLITFGGERCSLALWQRLDSYVRSAPPGERSVQTVYGATECAIDSTMVAVGATPAPSIGVPQGNTRIHVLDDGLDPVPVGAVGELYISGEGVGRGYLGQPRLTAAAYLPDPFATEPGRRMYRTGDLGRYRHDGVLEFAGRRDGQVKILGERVEPEEVEAVLLGQPAVRSGAVVVHESDGDGQLVAYVVPAGAPDEPFDAEDLLNRLAARLPAHMLPAAVLPVPALPVTANGKTDRRRLLAEHPPGAHPAPGGDTGTRRPGTAVERLIARIWREELGVGEPDSRADFFALGGNSVLAVFVMTELNNALGIQLPLAALLTEPSIASLAVRAEDELRRTAGERPESTSVVPLTADEGHPVVVLLHPVGGTAFCYQPLAEELAGDVAVLGVQWDFAAGTPSGDLRELAQRYARDLRQAAGGDRPLYLAGWSLGGVLAHAVACELREAGAEVAGLVLIDSDLSEAGARTGDLATDVPVLAELRDAVEAGHIDAVTIGRIPGIDGLLRRHGTSRSEIAALDPEALRGVVSCWCAMIEGLLTHRPKVFEGDTTLLLSDQHSAEVARVVRDSWPPAVSGRFSTVPVHGEHFELLERTHVPAVAHHLRRITGSS
ncbi:amino acid adenylation domain-containing protein [Streptomyces sp. JH002]|uniref:amino acid adenylation domain-containing protein n=1 Tax=Streptomyces sp. JH002 TaxID=2763259 RepID=UPI003D807BF1